MSDLLPRAGQINGFSQEIAATLTDVVIDIPAGARAITLYFIKGGMLVEGRVMWSESDTPLTSITATDTRFASLGPSERYFALTPGPVANGYLHVAAFDAGVTVRGAWFYR